MFFFISSINSSNNIKSYKTKNIVILDYIYIHIQHTPYVVIMKIDSFMLNVG